MLALRNGRIFTGHAWVRSLLIDGRGRVEAASADPAAIRAADSIDLGGAVVLPGLIDAHLHLADLAGGRRVLVFTGLETPGQLLEAVAGRAAETEPGGWILGRGYDDSRWPAADTVGREQLDRAAPGRPVFLERKDGHSGLASSLAISRAGIFETAPDPPGGRFERDARGRLNGLLRERARERLFAAVPKPSPADLERSIGAALSDLARLGLTTVCTIGTTEEFAALRRLEARGALPIRVCQVLYGRHLDELRAMGLRAGSGGDRLWVYGVKYFADGSLGSQTAWLEEPYAGTQNLGMATLSTAELAAGIIAANQAGLAVAVHAIGDRALRETLAALNGAPTGAIEAAGFRNRVEHVQLGTPASFALLAEQGLIASMQPIHAPSDRALARRWWGPRCRYAYAWRSVLRAGATLAFGSDAPIESPDPLLGLRAAVTREPEPDDPGMGERLSLLEAVDAYTRGAALAVGRGDRLGALTPGSLADFTILEGEPGEITARVQGTYVEGRPVAPAARRP